jgi:hypothetical protein
MVIVKCTIFDCFTPEDGTGCPKMLENSKQHMMHSNAEEQRPQKHLFAIQKTVHRDIFL